MNEAATGGPGQEGGADLPPIWHIFGERALVPRLLLLAKMIERAAARHLQKEFGFSVAQWRVLAFVCISGPATASFIGEAAEADQAEISRAIKALIEKGLVTRDFAQGSRKAMLVSPTASGQARFETIRLSRQTYFTRITRTLEPEQRASLNLMLDGIAREVVLARTQSG